MIRLLLDMDGVLVKDKALNPFPETADLLTFLRKNNVPFRVVSNNSTKPTDSIVGRLKEKGINISEEEFISPVGILKDYLIRRKLTNVFFIGTQDVEDYLRHSGIEVRRDYRVQAVVIGQDRNINFEKIKIATSAIFLSSAKIIPINLSRIVKDDDGLYFPGAGSLAYMLAHACNYNEEIPNLGKPSKDFIEFALLGLKGDETYLVSDDLYTDLIGAKDLCIKTVFMTTGKYDRRELERANFHPDIVFDNLKQLMSFLETSIE
ncbi:MAG: HAD-IIA family hydrolase [Aquificaceae bacterium]